MAELLGKLRSIDDMVKVLKGAGTLIQEGRKLWLEIYDLEDHFLKNSVHKIFYQSQRIKLAITGLNDFFGATGSGSDGPIQQFRNLRFQYPVRLKPGELFDNWAITAGAFTVIGARGRISNLGTDTNSRLATSAIISVTNAEDSDNNGIYTLTSVGALALNDTTNPWTANTEDTKAIVTLVNTV